MFIRINDYTFINLNQVVRMKIETAHKEGPNYPEGEVFEYRVIMELSSGKSEILVSGTTHYQTQFERKMSDFRKKNGPNTSEFENVL